MCRLACRHPDGGPHARLRGSLACLRGRPLLQPQSSAAGACPQCGARGPPCLEQGMCCSGVLEGVPGWGLRPDVCRQRAREQLLGGSLGSWVPLGRPLCGRACGWHRRPLLLSAAPSVCPRARAQVRMIRAELGRRWRARWGLDSGWSAGGSPAAGAPAAPQRAAVPS